jgi:serine/threonine protein kinase
VLWRDGTGGDLKNLLARQPKKRLVEAWAQFYVAELVEAVAYLHQMDITHRDIKTTNCMINMDGHIKLIDFGLSHQNRVSLQQVSCHDTFHLISYHLIPYHTIPYHASLSLSLFGGRPFLCLVAAQQVLTLMF